MRGIDPRFGSSCFKLKKKGIIRDYFRKSNVVLLYFPHISTTRMCFSISSVISTHDAVQYLIACCAIQIIALYMQLLESQSDIIWYSKSRIMCSFSGERNTMQSECCNLHSTQEHNTLDSLLQLNVVPAFTAEKTEVSNGARP